MHSKSDNIEFTTYHNANGVVDELFQSLLSRYHIGIETSMWGSDFIFNSVQMLYYKFHKTNFKCSGSYIDSPDWIKKKKITINSKNYDEKCFQYATIIALNFEEIKKDPQSVSNIYK